MTNSQSYGMSTTVDTKFYQDILHVEFHSAFTDVEKYRNIPIAFPFLSDHREYLHHVV